MKLNLLTLFTCLSIGMRAQILINQYENFAGQPTPNYLNNAQVELFTSLNAGSSFAYTGEYEIFIGDLFWRTQYPNNAISYKHELVGFPFTIDCANFPLQCKNCNLNPAIRNLYMPNAYNSNDLMWDSYLTNVSDQGQFLIGNFSYYPTSFLYKKYTSLISSFFTSTYQQNWAPLHSTLLPHSIIKTTIYLHCNNSVSSPVINKFSFYTDNTRGRMRDYPFVTNNCSSSEAEHDIIFRPKVVVPLDINGSAFLNYDDFSSNASWTEQSGTINYFKFSEIAPNSCVVMPTSTDKFWEEAVQSFNYAYLPPTILIASPPYEEEGSTLAGYLPVSSNTSLVIRNGIRHNYFIDKNIDLSVINPSELIVYNPTEVSITSGANDLHFPSYYTFKTISGKLPYKSKVIADNNDPQCGGPYADLRDVPVRTDLRSENANDPQDPNTPWHSVYSSRYYLKNGSKLTIEPCVNIFDATFDVKEGATLVFENQQYNLGFEHKNLNQTQNLGRFKIKGLGGAILRNYNHTQYVQNGKIKQPYNLHYIATSTILAGATVAAIVDDDDQLPGNYSIEPGGDVQFTAPDLISLRDGFSAKTGCTFKAKCESPVMQPQCPPSLIGSGGSKMAPQFAQQNKTNASSGIIIPNPSNGIFTYRTINFSPENTASIEVINSMGIKLISKMIDDENTNFDSSGILTASLTQNGKGVYYLKAMNGKNVRVEKVVVK